MICGVCLLTCLFIADFLSQVLVLTALGRLEEAMMELRSLLNEDLPDSRVSNVFPDVVTNNKHCSYYVIVCPHEHKSFLGNVEVNQRNTYLQLYYNTGMTDLRFCGFPLLFLSFFSVLQSFSTIYTVHTL